MDAAKTVYELIKNKDQSRAKQAVNFAISPEGKYGVVIELTDAAVVIVSRKSLVILNHQLSATVFL